MSILTPTVRRELLAVFVGGAAGAAARVALSQRYPSGATEWPWIVFAINVSGSLLLGYVVTAWPKRPALSAYRRPLIGTGFCGAYTTFSTMQLELLKMVDHRRYGLAVGYAVGSVTAGYLAVHVATATTRRRARR